MNRSKNSERIMPSAADDVTAETPSPRADEAEWWVAGAHPVIDGVFRVPMPMPSIGLRAMNAYALVDEDGLLMIDSGWSPLSESRTRLESSLRQIGYSLSDIRGFMITHLHRDHYTYAVEHRREFGSWIRLGGGERASLAAFAGFTGRPHEVEFARLRHDGAATLAAMIQVEDVDASIWESPDEWIHPGSEYRVGGSTLTAIAAPGHTVGHLIYLDEPRRLVYTGDHILPRITPTVGSEAALTPKPLSDFMASLEYMRTLPDSLVLPAHGAPTARLHARSDELLLHHLERLATCAEMVNRESATATQIASRLRWTRKQLTLDALTPDNQMRAIFETAAHLELLARRSEIRTFDSADVAYFNKPGVGSV